MPVSVYLVGSVLTTTADSSECRDTPSEAEVASSDFNSIQVLLTAAEQSGPLSPLHRTSSNSSVLDQAPSQAQATEGLLAGELMMYGQGFDLLYDPDWELIWDEERRHSSGAA